MGDQTIGPGQACKLREALCLNDASKKPRRGVEQKNAKLVFTQKREMSGSDGSGERGGGRHTDK